MTLVLAVYTDMTTNVEAIKEKLTRIQILTTKINSNTSKNTKWNSYIEVALQVYFRLLKVTGKEKHKKDEEAQKTFPVKGTGEFT